jgi:uncharacterized protein
MSTRRSALFVGTVRHRRHRPRPHAFRYRTYHVLLDLDELPRLDREVRGFGYRRAAVTSFHDTDHLGPLDLPAREKLRRWLADQGVTLPDGPVRVLTNLRVLGHVFNPVSWWFCHDRDGEVALIVAEVNNTFGESHSYLLDDLERDGPVVRARTTKAFHVSPFLPIDGLVYRVAFVLRPERITVHMDVEDAQGRVFDATQDGRRRSLERLPRTLVSHPLMTLWTVAAIHLQALRLFAKRIPFHRKPTPPPDGYPRSASMSEAATTGATASPAPDRVGGSLAP